MDIEFGSDLIPSRLDTGSSTLAVPATGAKPWLDCSSCSEEECSAPCPNPTSSSEKSNCCSIGSQISPFYNLASGTSVSTSADAPWTCYGTGGWSGEYIKDTVTIGSGASSLRMTDTTLVAITDNLCSGGEYFWSSQGSNPPKGTGIIGLAYPELTPNPAATLDNLKNHGVPWSFSLYMCPAYPDTSGVTGKSLGEIQFDDTSALIDTEHSGGLIAWVPITTKLWYCVDLYSVTILNTLEPSKVYGSTSVNKLPGTEYNSIFDSGTGYLGTLPAAAYDEIVTSLFNFESKQWFRDFMSAECVAESQFQGSLLDFPTILFNFTSSSSDTPTQLALSPLVYLANPQCGPGSLGFAIKKASSDPAILGNAFLSQYSTVFDAKHQKVGFMIPSPSRRLNTCGCVYGRRHGHSGECRCLDTGNDGDIHGSQCTQLSWKAAAFFTAFNRFVIPGSLAVQASSSHSINWELILLIVGCVVVVAGIGGMCVYMYYHSKNPQDVIQEPELRVLTQATKKTEYGAAEKIPMLPQDIQLIAKTGAYPSGGLYKY